MLSLENPDELLDEIVREMREDLLEMKRTSASIIAAKKRIDEKYTLAQKIADDWYSKAQYAIEKGLLNSFKNLKQIIFNN